MEQVIGAAIKIGLESLVKELEKDGLTRVAGTAVSSETKRSMAVIDRYEKNKPLHYGRIDDLQETAQELMAVNKKLEEKERAEQSPLSKAVYGAQRRVVRYFGRPSREITSQDLLEEKMRLAERFNQQLVETKDEVNSTWKQVALSKDSAREEMLKATQTYNSTATQLSRDIALYEQVAQQLEQMKKTDPEWLPLVRARDTLRMRMELAEATQINMCDAVVAKEREVSLLETHERVMMGLTSRLGSAASAAEQGIKLAYRTHAIAQFYKEGRKKMELFDSLQEVALKFIDIEKEAREMSDVVERNASRSERAVSAFGRMNSRLGEYSNIFRNVEENKLKSVEQRALDIMNSSGG